MRRATTLRCVIVLVMTCAAGLVAAQDTTHPRAMNLPESRFQPPDPDVLRQQLDGGLTAYVVPDRVVPLVTLRALIGAGSADAPGAGAYVQAVRGMTARFEVSQTPVRTEVELQVPAEDLDEALKLLVALLRDPLRQPADESRGRSAVEAASGESGPVLYEGSLGAAVSLLHGRVFSGHPYHEVPAAGGGDAATFAQRFVVPANVVLAVSGDLDPERTRQRLATLLDDWTGPLPELPRHPAPQPAADRAVHGFPVDALQGWVAIGHELPEVPLQDEAALAVMNYVLGGGHFDTRLFRATRDRRGLTNDDSGFLEPNFRGPGLYSFRTYGRPEAVRLLIALTLQEIERMRAEPVSEEELFVAQGALADGDFSLWFRDGASTARTYAIEWLQWRDHERSRTWRDRVRAVTAAQVLDAAQRYLYPERMQIVVVGPIDRIEAAPSMEGEGALDSFGHLERH